MRDLDDHDRALLMLLQRNALSTADELAKDVALSASAIARRVRRLRENGTIAADVAIVSDDAGPFLSALIDVQLDRHARAAVEGLLKRLSASVHVQAVLEVAGPHDLTLLVVADDMLAYNAFADAMLADDPVVRRYETRFIKKRRKFTTALPLA